MGLLCARMLNSFREPQMTRKLWKLHSTVLKDRKREIHDVLFIALNKSKLFNESVIITIKKNI